MKRITMHRPTRQSARVFLASLATLGSLLVAAPPASATISTGLPSCNNYTHYERFGHVNVDLRYDPATGRYSTLSVIWYIDDVPGSAVGTYNWVHIVNGKPASNPHLDIKDDNLHTILRMVENGKTTFNYGDRYKFQATHYSPETHATYVAAVNECVIIPR